MKSYDDLDVLGLNDPTKRKEASRLMSSAKDVADYYDYQDKKKAAITAHNLARADAELKKTRLEEMRFEAIERASQERERIELIRYQAGRRLNIIAIWISVVSAVFAAISILR